MTLENKKTYEAISEYSNEEKIKATRLAHRFNLIGIISVSIFLLIYFLKPDNSENIFMDFCEGLSLGITFGSVIAGYIFTGIRVNKLMEAKQRILSRK